MPNLNNVRAAEVNPQYGSEGRTAVTPTGNIVAGAINAATNYSNADAQRQAQQAVTAAAAKKQQDAVDAGTLAGGVLSAQTEVLIESVEDEMKRKAAQQAQDEGVDLGEDGEAVLNEAARLGKVTKYLRETGQFGTYNQLVRNVKQVEISKARPDLLGDVATLVNKIGGEGSVSAILKENEDAIEQEQAKRKQEAHEIMVDYAKAGGYWTPEATDQQLAAKYFSDVQPYHQRIAMMNRDQKEIDAQLGLSAAQKTRESQKRMDDEGPSITITTDLEIKRALQKTQGAATAVRLQAIRDVRQRLLVSATDNYPDPAIRDAYMKQVDAQVALHEKIQGGGEGKEIAETELATRVAQAKLAVHYGNQDIVQMGAVWEALGPAAQYLAAAPNGMQAIGDTLGRAADALRAINAQTTVPPVIGSLGQRPSTITPEQVAKETKDFQTGLGAMMNKGTLNQSDYAYTAGTTIGYLNDAVAQSDVVAYQRFMGTVADPAALKLYQNSPYAPQLKEASKLVQRRGIAATVGILNSAIGTNWEGQFTISQDEQTGEITYTPTPGSKLDRRTAAKLSTLSSQAVRAYAHLNGNNDYVAAADVLGGKR